MPVTMIAAPDIRVIAPRSAPLDSTVVVPGSKSYTNRALVLAALAAGTSTLRGALFSDDTLYMAEGLRQLGFSIDESPDDCVFAVEGLAGKIPSQTANVFVGNSGTTARFLAVLMTLGQGRYRLDGSQRMRERPIHPLVAALNALGGTVQGENDESHIPLVIDAAGLPGGDVRIPGNLSSQYISGLLLGAPLMQRGLRLTTEGHLVSRPYVEMTRQAMADFGVEVIRHAESYAVAAGQTYTARAYDVEPDASAASYFFGAAAILGGRVTVRGLGARSLQGDLQLVKVFERMGCTLEMSATETTLIGPPKGQLRGTEVDMSDLSDVAQTLAAVAPFAYSPTRITGIGFIRGKETDRIGAVVRELNRLGVHAVEESDGLMVHPSQPRAGQIKTYDDHRMAMSFSLIGLRVPGIRIEDPGCTAKTFPRYFDVLDAC